MDKSIDNFEVEGQKERRGLRHRAVLLVVIVVVIVAVAGYLAFKNERQSGTPAEQAIQTSGESFDEGDYQQAREDLESALDSTDDDGEKVALYTRLAATAASEGNVKEALGLLDKKHQIDPETAKADAYIMAQYYERLDERKEAREQYKIALQYLRALPNSDGLDVNRQIEIAKARISDLEGR